MGMLGNTVAVRIEKRGDDGPDGDRFSFLYEDPAKAHRAGYTMSSKHGLTETQVREILSALGATEAEMVRILSEARGASESRRPAS
jgi:hypothetical protein